MRFVAGRDAVAELLAGSAMAKRMAALWQRAIGKMLLAGAPWWLSYCWPGDATEQDAAGRGAVAQLNTIRGSRWVCNVERACCLAARRY